MTQSRKVLIVGAGGQLATSLGRVFPSGVTALSRAELDISDIGRVREAVRAIAPFAVINAAALRRPDICEDEPERAFSTNALGPRNLALACADVGAALVQVSSDNVFDGMKMSPYVEGDETRPINVYGVSKLAAELFVRSILEKHYIVRASGLFGEGTIASGKNFVTTMLRQAREKGEAFAVTDQFVSPTYTIDLAHKIAWLVTTGAYGTYHIANAGECSWHVFAQAIFRRAGVGARLRPVTTDALRVRAPRLRYAVLKNGALRDAGADDLRPWEDALEQYVRTL